MEKSDKIELFERTTPQIRGVLAELPTIKHLKVRQFVPTNPDQLPWLEHVWSVEWDMPKGVQHMQRTVPFPAFNLVADKQRGPALYGCTSGCFEYPVTLQGLVIGIRFKPALQSAFYDAVASGLTDTSVEAESVFSSGTVSHLEQLASQIPEVHDIKNFLERLSGDARPISDGAKNVHQMVHYIETHPNVFRVADIVRIFGRSERTIQRQFQSHLGMTPKSVIERFRIQSAISLFSGNGEEKFAALALRLGYFDQAHFINAFRQAVGHSPAEYANRLEIAMVQAKADLRADHSIGQ